MISFSEEKTIKIWDISDKFKFLNTINNKIFEIFNACYSNDGSEIIILCSK